MYKGFNQQKFKEKKSLSLNKTKQKPIQQMLNSLLVINHCTNRSIPYSFTKTLFGDLAFLSSHSWLLLDLLFYGGLTTDSTSQLKLGPIELPDQTSNQQQP